jgi:hypothetical protein
MIKIYAAAATVILSIAPACAQDTAFAPAAPFYAFQRSVPAGPPFVIPPYRHLFQARVFSTRQHDPIYNVPPYAVVTPF